MEPKHENDSLPHLMSLNKVNKLNIFALLAYLFILIDFISGLNENKIL